MDFELSDEQQLLRKTVREFGERELAPHSREWDEKQEFPRQVFVRLGELGIAVQVAFLVVYMRIARRAGGSAGGVR